MELLMPCRVFPQCKEDIRAENTRIIHRPTLGHLSFQASLHRDFVCAAHVFPPLVQLWDTPRALCHQDDSRTRYARPPSATSVLKMHSGRRRTSQPKIRTEMLDGWEGARKHHDEGTSASRELNDSLPGNVSATDTYPVERTPFTTRSLLSSGTCRWIL